MIFPRVIPILLLSCGGLVKTQKFSKPVYIGDPINAVKIFNDKEVDEIILLDIDASRNSRQPNYKYIEEIASESFMPFAYGGGISDLNHVRQLVRLGAEKMIINHGLLGSFRFLQQVADVCGSQSVVAAIDVKKTFFGSYEVYDHVKKAGTGINPIDFARQAVANGAGEIMINSVDNDGAMHGYDLKLIGQVTSAVAVPVIACGGAANAGDLKKGVQQAHASAVAAGSMFVFHGKHKAVLINYPSRNEIIDIFN